VQHGGLEPEELANHMMRQVPVVVRQGREFLKGFKAPTGDLSFEEWLADVPSDQLLTVTLSKTQTVRAEQLLHATVCATVICVCMIINHVVCTLAVLQGVTMTKAAFLKAHNDPNDRRHPMNVIDLEFSHIPAMMAKFTPPFVLEGE
jgi:hypothetical protein